MDPGYYVRVNFTGLIDIVDALGGIEVDSQYTFNTTYQQYISGGAFRSYHFDKGINKINGEQALAFCRERYNLPGGDNQRGKHQMMVIKAIVDKAASSQILSSYDELLKAVEGCFITNMPYEDMSALVKMQLKDMTGWNITSYAVTGSGDMQVCATMPGMKLWVMQPNQKSVDTAKALVQQVMNGEVPTLPQ